MSRVLTGIQSTNVPHLGNILGAILPAIEMSKTPGNESFLFIADFHSMTQIKDAPSDCCSKFRKPFSRAKPTINLWKRSKSTWTSKYDLKT